MDNHKRIYRIYKEEGLQVRKRSRKRTRTQRSFELQVSEGPNQRKRPTGVLLYIGKIHAILAVWNQSTLKFV
jgi:hypothetical protein